MYDVGTWALDKVSQKKVKIIEIDELWNYKIYTIYEPEEEEIYNIGEDNLSPLDIKECFNIYELRYLLLDAKIKNAISNGILSSIGDSIIPLPHQLYALNRALSDNNVRYLLADEVGLGKTIEAGLIIKELKLRGLVKKILIVSPKSLMVQWRDEMKSKFNEDFKIIQSEDFDTLRRLYGKQNIWINFNQIICSMDSIKPLEKRTGWDENRIREYNRERLDSLEEIDWDLIIIDEAHRVAGSSSDVARYKMARALADVSPYLLLLTATPHQGKTEPFLRLIRLLDKEAFPGINAVIKEQVVPYVIRTEKREAIDGEGNMLFKNRVVNTIDIPWEKRHSLQRQLYNDVTEYVRYGYNQAKKEKKNYIGFLMVLMQRLVTSSTRATRDYLERRLEILENQQENLFRFSEEDFYDGDMEESLKELIKIKSININEEKKDIKRLLALSKRAENQYMDCKAEVLLNYILKLDVDMDDLKLLIFTEFISTQKYLKKLLESKGYRVTILNGSLTLNQRVGVLEEFRQKAQILISTDAGGEGLNLQFCHTVINYDLPWNPMKIEQRIGRVDRIGQEKDVVAYNFILKNTVEYRVREVLEEKLIIIQEQYGVDKMGDVLDSSQSEMDFTQVYMRTIANPEYMDYFLEKIEKDVQDKTKRIMESKELIKDEKILDKSMVEDTINLPIDTWVKDMYINYQLSKDNPVDLIHKAEINLNNQEVKEILKANKPWIKSEQIPIIEVPGLNNERGFWSLWEVSIGKEDRVEIFPMFINDKGIFRLPSSNIIWDNLIDESNTILNKGSYTLSQEQYNIIYEQALDLGYNIFEKMKTDYDKKLVKYVDKYNRAFQLKEEAIRNIGLESVKKFRLKKLDMEKKQWNKDLEKKKAVLPSLKPMSIIYLE